MGTAYILTVEGRMVGVFTRLDLLEEAKAKFPCASRVVAGDPPTFEDTTPEVSEVELDPQFGKPGLRLYQAMVSWWGGVHDVQWVSPHEECEPYWRYSEVWGIFSSKEAMLCVHVWAPPWVTDGEWFGYDVVARKAREVFEAKYKDVSRDERKRLATQQYNVLRGRG